MEKSMEIPLKKIKNRTTIWSLLHYLSDTSRVVQGLRLYPSTVIKWALGSTATNKSSGGDRIPVELFQILEDDAVKVLPSICQQIWKTQQWLQD